MFSTNFKMRFVFLFRTAWHRWVCRLSLTPQSPSASPRWEARRAGMGNPVSKVSCTSTSASTTVSCSGQCWTKWRETSVTQERGTSGPGRSNYSESRCRQVQICFESYNRLFFGHFEKNSRPKKLKPKKNWSKSFKNSIICQLKTDFLLKKFWSWYILHKNLPKLKLFY